MLGTRTRRPATTARVYRNEVRSTDIEPWWTLCLLCPSYTASHNLNASGNLPHNWETGLGRVARPRADAQERQALQATQSTQHAVQLRGVVPRPYRNGTRPTGKRQTSRRWHAGIRLVHVPARLRCRAASRRPSPRAAHRRGRSSPRMLVTTTGCPPARPWSVEAQDVG